MRADPYGDGPPSSFTWGRRWSIRPCPPRMSRKVAHPTFPMSGSCLKLELVAHDAGTRRRRHHGSHPASAQTPWNELPPADAITARFQGSILMVTLQINGEAK